MKQRLFLILIGMCFFILNPACTQCSEITDDYLDIAKNYFGANNYQKALEYISEILKIEPQNQCAIDLKNKILPLITVHAAAEDDGTLSSSQETPAVPSQQLAGMPDDIEPLKKFEILNIAPADVEKMDYNSDYYNEKGREFYAKKDLNLAIEYFFKAINLDKRNAQAYNNLGMCYRLKNNTNLAVKYFKQAHRLNKDYTQPLVNMALLYKQLGCTGQEFFYLQKALKYNPNDYWAYYLLGDYFKDKGLYPKALENYKEAIKINNTFTQAYMALAMTFFETEEFNYTLAALNKYNELSPGSDYSYYMLARTNLVLGRYDAAKQAILKAIEINYSIQYKYELAKIEYYLENYPEALSVFKEIFQIKNSAEVLNYSGLCNYKLKNIDEAISDFGKAIELDGLRPVYYYNLALCYKTLDDKKNYIKYTNAATKITPIKYQDYIDLSYIYFDNGNASYAINTLDNAIKTYPDVKALYLSKLKIYEVLDDNFHYNKVKEVINMRFNEK